MSQKEQVQYATIVMLLCGRSYWQRKRLTNVVNEVSHEDFFGAGKAGALTIM